MTDTPSSARVGSKRNRKFRKVMVAKEGGLYQCPLSCNFKSESLEDVQHHVTVTNHTNVSAFRSVKNNSSFGTKSGTNTIPSRSTTGTPSPHSSASITSRPSISPLYDESDKRTAINQSGESPRGDRISDSVGPTETNQSEHIDQYFENVSEKYQIPGWASETAQLSCSLFDRIYALQAPNNLSQYSLGSLTPEAYYFTRSLFEKIMCVLCTSIEIGPNVPEVGQAVKQYLNKPVMSIPKRSEFVGSKLRGTYDPLNIPDKPAGVDCNCAKLRAGVKYLSNSLNFGLQPVDGAVASLWRVFMTALCQPCTGESSGQNKLYQIVAMAASNFNSYWMSWAVMVKCMTSFIYICRTMVLGGGIAYTPFARFLPGLFNHLYGESGVLLPAIKFVQGCRFDVMPLYSEIEPNNQSDGGSKAGNSINVIGSGGGNNDDLQSGENDYEIDNANQFSLNNEEQRAAEALHILRQGSTSDSTLDKPSESPGNGEVSPPVTDRHETKGAFGLNAAQVRNEEFDQNGAEANGKNKDVRNEEGDNGELEEAEGDDEYRKDEEENDGHVADEKPHEPHIEVEEESQDTQIEVEKDTSTEITAESQPKKQNRKRTVLGYFGEVWQPQGTQVFQFTDEKEFHQTLNYQQAYLPHRNGEKEPPNFTFSRQSKSMVTFCDWIASLVDGSVFRVSNRLAHRLLVPYTGPISLNVSLHHTNLVRTAVQKESNRRPEYKKIFTKLFHEGRVDEKSVKPYLQSLDKVTNSVAVITKIATGFDTDMLAKLRIDSIEFNEAKNCLLVHGQPVPWAVGEILLRYVLLTRPMQLHCFRMVPMSGYKTVRGKLEYQLFVTFQGVEGNVDKPGLLQILQQYSDKFENKIELVEHMKHQIDGGPHKEQLHKITWNGVEDWVVVSVALFQYVFMSAGVLKFPWRGIEKG